MLGAIAGDIIGSPYEFHPIKTASFPLYHLSSRYTDDTVLTVATADSLLSGATYRESYQDYFRMFPTAGYGQRFALWALAGDAGPYQSWGNGSAMRVSPVGFAAETLDEALREAELSAAVTHDHPDAIRGAQATAAVIFLARQGADRGELRRYVRETFDYPLTASLDEMRPTYRFDVSCLGTVPPAIQALLESTDYESAVRLAVSLGGDSDTLACITGGMAQAFYGGVPQPIVEQTLVRLPDALRDVVTAFSEEFGC